ncbi:hypothetical protein CMI37_23470 [Candidatus Pacearchaeota archaeon]|nr:hypothetical protein [Candidatus Pacearchaeota archaeon]|tara:strand:+ start:784 stop:969 length:186 start_codon:yes stop_codon:yes gene_type:complete
MAVGASSCKVITHNKPNSDADTVQGSLAYDIKAAIAGITSLHALEVTECMNGSVVVTILYE